MSDLTKIALENALKEALANKPLEKITITELTDACGLSRMTFYYHFQDIYELAEWSLMKETESALAGRLTRDTWQQALQDLFDLVIENRKYIGGLLHPSTREHLEKFINRLTDAFFLDILKELSQGLSLKEEDEEFIAAFYRHAFVGMIIDWVMGGMEEAPEEMIRKLRLIIEGNLSAAIRRFAEA
jgi:probable dihydroxyacetone kinase regulator